MLPRHGLDTLPAPIPSLGQDGLPLVREVDGGIRGREQVVTDLERGVRGQGEEDNSQKSGADAEPARRDWLPLEAR